MENSSIQMFRQTIKKLDEDTIFIKPLCDFFQIDSEYQVENIRNDRILSKSYGKKRNKILFGDNYPRVFLTQKGFIRWIQIINSNTVAEHLKEKFEIYQELLFDYMFGNMDREREMSVKVRRINKLVRLYSKIGLEIKAVKADINLYLNERFEQKTIDFKPQKSVQNEN